ncbi:MAG: ABC transporter substrate-binding protein, partial [Paludibacterium sp.]
MKKLFFTLLPLLALAMPVIARADVSPVDFVRDNSKQVMETLKKDDGHNTRKVREQVEAMVLPKFDFKRMTALAVGKSWRTATPDQQDQLATQFQTLLVRVYASTMTRYKNAQIDVKPNAILNN